MGLESRREGERGLKSSGDLMRQHVGSIKFVLLKSFGEVSRGTSFVAGHTADQTIELTRRECHHLVGYRGCERSEVLYTPPPHRHFNPSWRIITMIKQKNRKL